MEKFISKPTRPASNSGSSAGTPDTDRAKDTIEIEKLGSGGMRHTPTTGSQERKTIPRNDTGTSLPAFGGGKTFPPSLHAVRDAYVVDFDGPNDPTHPLNWPFRTKVLITAIGIYQVFGATFASAILSAPSSRIAEYFDVGLEVASLVTVLYLLGFVTGPMVFGPLSELYGRKAPMVLSVLGFSIFGLATAVAKDVQTLMICRFFQGVFGSGPVVVLAGICADIWPPEQRGPALTSFAVFAFLPAMLAPFVGAFTVESDLGWRWDAYWTAILGFSSLILTMIFLKESYPPVVLIAKAKLLRRLTQDWAIHAKQEEIEVDLVVLLEKNFTRPLTMLVKDPILTLAGIYVAFDYGLMYMTLAAYPFVFQGVHGMAPGVGSLPFLGIVIGMIISGATAIFANKSWVRKFHANNNKAVPEWRMPIATVGAVSFTIGIFWFGWTGNYHSIHWIVPSIAGVFIGFGILTIFIQLITYVIESYLMYAASAAAGNMMARSLFAAITSLFDRQMFQAMGIQWGCTLLGCVALLLVPVPLVFAKYGFRLRQKSVWAPTPQPIVVAKDEKKEPA